MRPKIQTVANCNVVLACAPAAAEPMGQLQPLRPPLLDPEHVLRALRDVPCPMLPGLAQASSLDAARTGALLEAAHSLVAA